MARTLVTITLFLWLLVLMLAYSVFRQPEVAFLPLYGLYPGEVSSGSPGYSLTKMHVWAVGAGLVFLVLGILGIWWKNKTAAIAFMVLFLLSIVVIVARFSEGLRDLH